MARKRLQLTRSRLYESVRTAHLERAKQLVPASIIYREKRYDFSEDLAGGLEIVHARPLEAAFLLARSNVTELEINEPLMLSSLPATALALLGLRFQQSTSGRRALVVSYAIGNTDPFFLNSSWTWKTRIRRKLERQLSLRIWARLDKIVYGTLASQTIYESLFPQRENRPERALIPALPSACSCHVRAIKDPDRIVFLGDLSERKGFPLLLAAWPEVLVRRPSARLTILGKGVLEGMAMETAASDSTVELHVDPSRDEIHRQLQLAHVLALPSQATSTWREQVGLPIVEGLAHGCSIVTTSETGLASWLRENGHSIVDPRVSSAALAESISTALAATTTSESIIAALPNRDGRLAADSWLFPPLPQDANQ